MKTLRQLMRHRLFLSAMLLVTGGIAASSLVRPRHAARAGEGGPADQPAHVAAADVPVVDRVLALLKGIPQNGVTLGWPSAPVELVEFADLQCPYCARANTLGLPALIEKFVRTGQVKLVFRNLTSLGPDSLTAAYFATAMGQQNHLWDFVELFFANQGREGSGYATDAFVQKLASAVPGVDVGRAMAQRVAAVTSQLDEAQAEARRLSVDGTPMFFLVKPGQPPERLEPSSLTPEGFDRALK